LSEDKKKIQFYKVGEKYDTLVSASLPGFTITAGSNKINAYSLIGVYSILELTKKLFKFSNRV